VRILLTGASSFTGLWFARALHRAGHEVVAPLMRAQGEYEGLRGRRVSALAGVSEIIWECPFGGEKFLALAAQGKWDRLCHHAAQVGDYRSPDFDIQGAVAANTHNLEAVLRAMKPQAVVITGSVFEPDEGTGTLPLKSFSPYGTSKSLTAEAIRAACGKQEIPLTKFTVPNPFGPYEEPRFCNYLMQCWFAGKPAAVKTPEYVRDNIHASLLALCYVESVAMAGSAPFRKYNPSGYVETQGAFAQRFAREIGRRLDLNCPLELAEQSEFAEPKIRVNTDKPDAEKLGWNETAAWDELAAYYRAFRSS